MHMVAVKSSNVRAVGYDPETETMRVEFANGRSYDYPGTSSEEHQRLVSAGSIGKHFHKHFRSRKYDAVGNS